MKRALVLSIISLLPSIALAVDATSPVSPAARYTLVRLEAAPTPAARYRLTAEASAANAGGRFHLLGTGADQSTDGTCTSADGLFASGFEN